MKKEIAQSSKILLIYFFLTRDTETKEERIQREQEERCSALLTQAIISCRCASGNAKEYQKTWEKPKNTVVQQAIWGAHPVGNPELMEILLNAWKAGDRDTELALQLMYASWDLWEQCYDYDTIRQRGRCDHIWSTIRGRQVMGSAGADSLQNRRRYSNQQGECDHQFRNSSEGRIMNPKQKFGMAMIIILLIISILLSALHMSYYKTPGYHFKKLAEFAFDESLNSCFKQKDQSPHPGSIYKNIAVTSHAQQIVFIFASIANYIIIAISLI